MITIIAWVLLINIIKTIIFKTDYSIIACGLAAFSPAKNLTEEQKAKVWANMKLLGIFNQSRGVHSCGLVINGQKYAGWDDVSGRKDTALFMNLLADNPDLKYESGVIMIHTRQATVGLKNEKNC